MVDTLRFHECAGLEAYSRAPLEVASTDPRDQTAPRLAIAAASEWLADTRAYDNPDIRHSREVAYERNSLSIYWTRVAETSPGYAQRIEELADTLPPMHPSCRVATNMPARQEAGTITDTLSHMLLRSAAGGDLAPAQRDSKGVLDPDTYEISILSNRPFDEFDDTVLAVKDFADSCPLPLRIHYLDVELPPDFANNGMARRILHDVTFVRSLRRHDQHQNLYILMEDADVMGYDPAALSQHAAFLDSHPERSASRARTDRNPLILSEIGQLFVRHRFMTQLVSVLHSPAFGPNRNPNFNFRFNRTAPSGYGTAVVAADLANAGGIPIAPYSSDLMLGDHLSVLFGEGRGEEARPAANLVGKIPAVVLSSPRRDIVSYIRETDPYQNGNFSDESINELVRTALADLVTQAKSSKDQAQSRARTQQQIQSGFERLSATAPNDERARRYMKRILVVLGFRPEDYAFEEATPGVRVRSWDNVERLADAYQPSARLKKSMFS